MAKPTAPTVPVGANAETVCKAAYESIKDKFNSPKGWMGCRVVNVIDDDKKVVDVRVVKFTKDGAHLFVPTGEYLPLRASVTVGKLQKK